MLKFIAISTQSRIIGSGGSCMAGIKKGLRDRFLNKISFHEKRIGKYYFVKAVQIPLSILKIFADPKAKKSDIQNSQQFSINVYIQLFIC